ncbi:ATP adenylyltransferase II [Fusarium coicis]|nr:ATP adenylyltransferase II [Fusarium coicis]
MLRLISHRKRHPIRLSTGTMTYDLPAPTTDGSALLSTFDALTKSGLVLYNENQKIVEHTDGDLKFHFVLTKALIKKLTLSTPEQSSASAFGNGVSKQLLPGSDIDTNGFEMGNSESSTHFLVANKFCFSRPHLMMLTRDRYRRKYKSLNHSDFEAAWGTLTSLNNETTDYAVFFNCGIDGGCSRLHRRVQLMPLPASGFAVDFLNSDSINEPKVSFEWFYHRFQDSDTAAAKGIEIYLQLLQQVTEAWKASTGKDVPQMDRRAPTTWFSHLAG